MDHTCYVRQKPKRKHEKHNCCVPQCSVYKNPSIHMHRVPSDPVRKKKWAVAIRTGKELTQYMLVCGKHFRKDDYLPTGSKKPSLKKTAVPSQNLPIRSHERVETSPVKRKKSARADRAKKRTMWVCEEENELETRAESFDSTDGQTSDEEGEANDGWLDVPDMEEEDIEKFKTVGVQVGTYVQNEAFVSSLMSSDSKLFSTTGLYSVEYLNDLTSFFNEVAPENPKKKFLLPTRDRILLTMMKIKLALSFSTLAVFFDISVQNACNYFYDSVRVLASLLTCLVEWPPKENILKNMPKCFATFKNTRIVLDCFELFVEKPKCVRCRTRLYSQYKKGYTLKVLLGCAPSGLISFVSRNYGGRASDKFITSHSKLYDKCEYSDGVMVDKGFAIEDECLQHCLVMIRPPFLRRKICFPRPESFQCSNIARARVHVERSIQRIREYHLLRNKLPWRLVPYFDDVVLIVCALVNLGAPILADGKFPQ
ncbi:uncharacterized protein LOC117643890 [Thrips palmi]|uniref:Uncharacterized protein LOC117643890 n=1 Tax=Thrips palmi TaxID=161013 RepID=A0A6P8ZLJ0_THRPL|nr:uncharacterized protein LOC117643890 [Thrips palmi]